MTQRFLLCLAFVASALVAAHAQILTPVTWTFSTEVADGKTYVVSSAKIDAGWYVYSQFLEDGGPEPTALFFDNPEAAQLLGKSVESGKRKAGYDQLFEMEVVKFAQNFSIRQEVKFAGEEPLRGYLIFMTCDDTRCLPPTEVEFSFEPPVGDVVVPIEESNLVGGSKVAPAIVQQIEQVDAELAQADAPTERKQPAILEPVTWSYAVQEVAENEYVLQAVANIEKGWTVYSQEVGEGGPVPTSFGLETGSGYELLGTVTERGKSTSGIDPVFEVAVKKFKAPKAYFEQRIRVTDPEAVIVGYLEFMTCDDSKCLPPSERFFRFAPARGFGEEISFEAYEALLAGTAAVAENAGTSTPTTTAAVAAGDLNERYSIDKVGENATCGDSGREVNVEASDSLLTVFLLGFGGGLLALLTPCVFPMIPLTVSFFTGRGKDRARGLRRALIYGASIIGIYVTLGLAITGVFGADALNLLSTNAWFNLAFGVLFIVFALSFFGFFEIQLPSSWANKTDRAADQGGLLGIFFMAFTLSLVSFSCTGPIIGTLLVETATGGGATILGRIPVAPLVGMFGFSAALAAPFTLFAAFPSALASLPKSGGWMNTVKVTLGFVEIALAMKFLSTADLIMGTKWLPYEFFTGVWVLCALGLAAYYFGLLKTPLGPSKRTPVLTGLGVFMLGFAVYLGLGFRYDEQSATFDTPLVLSGLAPPAGHSYIYPKECPQNLNCFKDLDEGLAFAKSVGKPVLVDFTGHGCVNCRKMEDNVWGEPGVYERLDDDYVLVSLYVDERKALEQPFVSSFSGQRIRTVGNKWADFQARYFDRNSQPYYVLMSPDAEVLTQPRAYTPDVEEYAAFLECGLIQYDRLANDAPVETNSGLSAL